MAHFPWKKGNKRFDDAFAPSPTGTATSLGTARAGTKARMERKVKALQAPSAPQRLPYSKRGREFEGEGIPPDMAIKGTPTVKQRRYRNA